MCGADALFFEDKRIGRGSPPRVRSRHFIGVAQLLIHGITSACAEQTTCAMAIRPRRTDHLRVCGADSFGVDATNVGKGSPPRVRSRLIRHGVGEREPGITSACAEQTDREVDNGFHCRDHLRVCGADFLYRAGGLTMKGSPPRVRSRPQSV